MRRHTKNIFTDMSKQIDKTIPFDQLSEKLKKKVRKRYARLEKKHPGITEQQLMEKIGRKLNMKLDIE